MYTDSNLYNMPGQRVEMERGFKSIRRPFGFYIDIIFPKIPK